MLNLVSNALKFTKPGQPPKIHIWARHEPERVHLMVADQGIGFDAARFQKRVFEPFRRLQSASKFPGSGMGLATCQRIAQLHGGQVSAISRPGHGASFEVSLPQQESS